MSRASSASAAVSPRVWPADGQAIQVRSCGAHSAGIRQPVTVVADPADEALARESLGDRIEVVAAPWTTPGCATSGRRSWSGRTARSGGVDWVFNGWGAQPWATWDRDTRIASFVAARAGAIRVLSPLVNEGGGIHVDGLGTVLLTQTVQARPGPQPRARAGRGRGRDGAHHRRDDLYLAAARAHP